MSDRPSLQFYPKDWKNNSKLNRCSDAARGAWMDIMCALHDSDEYGVLRWTLKEVARTAKVRYALAKELADKNVLKGSDKFEEDFTFAPKHAGRVGQAVTLVVANGGPCWFCSRFVKDEYVRLRRGSATQFTSENQPPKDAPKASPKGGIGDGEGAVFGGKIGTRQGDGPSSASASASAYGSVGNSPALLNFEVGENSRARAPDEPPPDEIPLNVQATMAMIAAGCSSMRVNQTHPELLAVLDAGGTPRMLADCVREGLGKKNPISEPFLWAIRTVRNRLAEAKSQPQPAGKHTAADDLRGKDYAGSGTRPDQLPPELRPDDIGVAAGG